jgi:hypothetical protein
VTQSIQSSFGFEPAAYVEGQLARTGLYRIEGRVVAARKLVSVVLTAVNSHAYNLTINGTAVTYTSDSSATTAEVAAGLVAAINASTETTVHASGSDTPMLIEATRDPEYGVDFTDTSAANRRLSGDFDFATADSNLVATTLVAQNSEVPVGSGLCMDERSTDDQSARLPRQATDITSFRFAGVMLNDLAKVAHPVGALQTSRHSTMLPVLSDGYVAVRVENAVAKGDQAYCRYASGAGGTRLGAFRGTDTDSSTAAACARCFFETAASAGGIAVLKVSR